MGLTGAQDITVILIIMIHVDLELECETRPCPILACMLCGGQFFESCGLFRSNSSEDYQLISIPILSARLRTLASKD